MRLKFNRQILLNPDGSKQLQVSVANASTGEPLEGLSFVGICTPIGTAPEYLELRVTQFDAPPEEVIRVVERQIPSNVDPPDAAGGLVSMSVPSPDGGESWTFGAGVPK